MLSNKNAMATIAVKDMPAARAFYEGTLGFKPGGMASARVVSYRSGQSTMVVYLSDFAGTNKATSATWAVGAELEAIVERLQAAGVAFEHYDMPGAKREGDIHVFGDFRGAWFKDPSGNILHINNA